VEFCEWLTQRRFELSRRLGRRVTQKEIADKAGISRAYLGFLETGINPSTGKPVAVDKDMVERLAIALSADVDEAMSVAGYGDQLSEKERKLLKQIRKLTPAQEKIVNDILQSYVDPNRPLAPV
jgi:transcriptional regulator with XRE-family HTH domain